ncbi:MAG: 50S ribosomal protein L3, partial [Candidatus Woesearchaeota archaeon]
MWRNPNAGKMGYHLRVDYNKWLLKISDKPEEINPKGGFINYGFVKNNYVLVKGSIPGPKKRLMTLTYATRPKNGAFVEAPSIQYISLESKQG